jgi:hypothetical protein
MNRLRGMSVFGGKTTAFFSRQSAVGAASHAGDCIEQ